MSSRLDPIALAVDKSGDNHNIDWEPTGRSSLDLLRRERPRRPSSRAFTPTCFVTPVAMPSRTEDTTPARCKLTSATKTFSIRPSVEEPADGYDSYCSSRRIIKPASEDPESVTGGAALAGGTYWRSQSRNKRACSKLLREDFQLAGQPAIRASLATTNHGLRRENDRA